MQKFFIIILLLVSFTGVSYAVESLTNTEVDIRIQSIQGNIPIGTPNLVDTSYDRKGSVGSMLSNIFDTADKKIKSYFIQAFRNILGLTNPNNIPKWNGQVFLPGTLTDSGSSIGVGTGIISPGLRLDVNGKIGASGYCDENGNNCFDTSNVQVPTAFTTYSSSIYYGSVLLETPQAYDVCMISKTNLSKRGGYNYNYGGGCSITKTTPGTWVLRTQGRRNVTARCSMLCR